METSQSRKSLCASKTNTRVTKLTWKAFKELCEQNGVNDSDIVDDIDISWGDRGYFKCEKDDVFGWKISLISK